MTHLALYRKYRPSGFEHLLGQDHIKRTLLNAINQNSISHAYVFSGPRGTGKTSSAKLFAKAVNCERSVNGEPCGTCDSCNDSNPDIIEIDAASNNGVDEIRELRDKIGYTPISGKYKVYIIDEVHMLTIGAFNALLKTLEEPPKHAIFILATTEPHKIPLTILSRCQRFDFKRITEKVLVERMKYIVQQEKVSVEDIALEIIARVAQGGMRDALSLLDQAISHSNGKVTLKDVIELTGTVDLEKLGKVVLAIEKKETSLVLDLLDEIVEAGKEPKFFLDDLLAYYRDILVYRRVGDKANLTKALTDQSFKQIAKVIHVENIYDVIDILTQCQNQIKYSGQDKVILEVALIKATSNSPHNEVAILKKEMESLKKLLAQGQLPVLEAATTISEATEDVLSMNELESMIEQTSESTKELEENIGDDVSSEELSSSIHTEDDVSSEPAINKDELEVFTHQMEGKDVTTPPVNKKAELNPEKELMELAGEFEPLKDDEEEVTNEIFDLFSQIESELETTPQISAPSEKEDLEPAVITSSEQELELVEDQIESTQEPTMSFIEKLQHDIENGADYIEVIDEVPPSDEHVPPEEDDHEHPVIQKGGLSSAAEKVLGLLSKAKKEYRVEYKQKNEQILLTLKKERMSVMSLYREAKVNAITDNHIVVSVETKPQVKLLQKVMNRSIIQGVLEECLGRYLELIVLEEKEWNQVVETFKNQ